MSCDFLPNRSASVRRPPPSGPSNTYSFSIATIGSLRRSALSASRCRVSSFSLTSRRLRAAVHSSRDTIVGLGMSFPFRFVRGFSVVGAQHAAPLHHYHRSMLRPYIITIAACCAPTSLPSQHAAPLHRYHRWHEAWNDSRRGDDHDSECDDRDGERHIDRGFGGQQ